MSIARIAHRYAKSLFDIAQERNKTEDVNKDVLMFAEVCKNSEFASLLKSPVVASDKKGAVIDAIFKGKVDDITLKFMHILLVKGREMYLRDVAVSFAELYRKQKNITLIKIVTAAELSKDSIEKIIDKLKADKAVLATVEVETEIDPSLIGGFIVKFDGQIYDASVSYNLLQLKKRFMNNTYFKAI
jgi:F-type H+-transporting ATPase subunit delta